jgi:hypothetical protein
MLLNKDLLACFIGAGLNIGDYRSKLVHFEAQKIFSLLKKP